MSATIDTGKLNFCVIGRGFEEERTDSGAGAELVETTLSYTPSFAAFDSTGAYLWISDNYTGLKKIQLSDMTEVATSISSYGTLLHPNNIDNNYGIAFDSSYNYIVFDLTDDTIAYSGSPATYIPSYSMDCIMVDDIVYFVGLTQGQSTISLYTLDLTNQTLTSASVSKRGCQGFVGEYGVFAYYTPEWFHQYKGLYFYDLTFTKEWSVTAEDAGSSGFPYISMTGFADLEYIYLPTYYRGYWRFGGYDVESAPDVETPAPDKFFGKFSSCPDLAYSSSSRACVYSTERTIAVMATSIGTIWTDYNDCLILDSTALVPLAVCDGYVALLDSSGYLKVVSL